MWIRPLLAMLCVAGMTNARPGAKNTTTPGASDTEIKLGQTMPYSGPLSAFATLGRRRGGILPE